MNKELKTEVIRDCGNPGQNLAHHLSGNILKVVDSTKSLSILPILRYARNG